MPTRRRAAHLGAVLVVLTSLAACGGGGGGAGGPADDALRLDAGPTVPAADGGPVGRPDWLPADAGPEATLDGLVWVSFAEATAFPEGGSAAFEAQRPWVDLLGGMQPTPPAATWLGVCCA